MFIKDCYYIGYLPIDGTTIKVVVKNEGGHAFSRCGVEELIDIEEFIEKSLSPLDLGDGTYHKN